MEDTEHLLAPIYSRCFATHVIMKDMSPLVIVKKNSASLLSWKNSFTIIMASSSDSHSWPCSLKFLLISINRVAACAPNVEGAPGAGVGKGAGAGGDGGAGASMARVRFSKAPTRWCKAEAPSAVLLLFLATIEKEVWPEMLRGTSLRLPDEGIEPDTLLNGVEVEDDNSGAEDTGGTGVAQSGSGVEVAQSGGGGAEVAQSGSGAEVGHPTDGGAGVDADGGAEVGHTGGGAGTDTDGSAPPSGCVT